MALIGTIRKNSWLLVVMVGLGLGGFIIMDMMAGQQSVFGGSQTTVGNINGKKLDWFQFQRTENILYGNSGADVFARRNALWNYYVEEAIIQDEAEAAGLGVSKAELLDLQFGPNPSPIIQQRFINPQTGQVDRSQLSQFQTAIQNGTLTSEQISFWAHQEKEIIKERLQSKLSNLISKGLYTPTWMAEMGNKDQNSQVSFTYVKAAFDEINSTEVALSDSDYENYIKENAARFETDQETRVLNYVVFEVKPTPEDTAQWKNEIAELVPEFEQAENDSNFVERHYGTIDAAYVKKDQLSLAVADTAFSLPVGSVYGPYFENGAFKAVKVIDRKVIPDSVRSRHILLRANSQLELINALNTVDSLKELIESGEQTFDSLAVAFSTDASNSGKGGDLGYAAPGAMVKPFNDMIFFEAEENELNTVITQFGIHLVEVTGRKFINNEEGVKVAYISRNIEPTEQTQNSIYDDVLEFVGQNRKIDQLEKAVNENPKLDISNSAPLKKNDFSIVSLGAGQSTRDMIRWAFQEAKTNDVSPEIYIYQDAVNFYNNKYVVAGLKSINKAGLSKVEDIKDQIEIEVTNLKKGEMLKERMAGKDLPALAADFGVPVDTASNISFSSAFIPNAGAEPAVVAAAFGLNEGETSQPVVGATGVYVVKLTSKTEAGSAANIPQLRRTMASNIRNQVNFRLMESLKDKAAIKDLRSKFY